MPAEAARWRPAARPHGRCPIGPSRAARWRSRVRTPGRSSIGSRRRSGRLCRSCTNEPGRGRPPRRDLAAERVPNWNANAADRHLAGTVGDQSLPPWAGGSRRSWRWRLEPDLPRDHEHLKRQRLVIETARRGGWRPDFEVAIDPLASRSRSFDVLLTRPSDARGHRRGGVGLAGRRRRCGPIERCQDRDHPAAISSVTPRTSRPPSPSSWVLRGTHRNREGSFAISHRSSISASRPAAWSGCGRLRTSTSLAPTTAGLLWTDVRGDRLFSRRLARRQGWPNRLSQHPR